MYKEKRQDIYYHLIVSEPYSSMSEFEYLRFLYNQTFG